MARHFVLVDDLDQSQGAQTVCFMVNGQEYEIDLSEENMERFHSALQEFIDAARPGARQPTPGRGRQRRQGSGSRGREDIPQIRAWAKANGYEVSARGQIKKEIIDAYDEAHR